MSFPPSPNDLGRDTSGIGARGIYAQLLIGSAAVAPAPAEIVQAVKSIEVTNTDSGRDGFQITFSIGRNGSNPFEYSIFNRMLVKPFTRVVIIVALGVKRKILVDGFITNHQFTPSDTPEGSTLTVTGEDYSVLMDMHEIPEMHTAQPDYVIANKLIARWGLVPMVIPPPQIELPKPTENGPAQLTTDLAFLKQMAGKYNYIFYVEPTDIVGVNKAYWGPAIVIDAAPQKALTANMGPSTNILSINFQYNALEPTMVFGMVQDKDLQNVPIPVIVPLPLPPYLAKYPAHIFNLPHVRNKIYRSSGDQNALQAYIEAIGEVDGSRNTITGSVELDTLKYGEILKARRLVAVRGAGLEYDGLYYVKRVTHKMERGSYKQSVSLSREGTGSIIPGVVSS
jgi:hypothetical protein